MQTKKFTPLPLNTIQAAGWTKRQLEIQASGLSGHLDEFWHDIKESGWIGGSAEGWERAPYWLDGLVPLAYLLDDAALKQKVNRWLDYILEHQHPDGWLGPVEDGNIHRQPYDPWPQYIILKVLSQYFEVSDDKRIIPAMVRNVRKIVSVIETHSLESWAEYRWAELLSTLTWLEKHLKETGGKEELLQELQDAARLFREHGFDWPGLFRGYPYKEKTPNGKAGMETHVVNNAMALKGPALAYLYSGKEEDAEDSLMMMETLDRCHGQITGMFTGDEHLAGLNPSQGTELCAVAEYLFSLEEMISVLGSADLGDRLEKIAFNAMPATFTDDMTAHQYDQQVNQVICTVSEDKIYTTNSGDANIFGLEPNYGCCTANMHQGWPKFLSHAWMQSPDRGLVCISPVPLHLSAPVGSSASGGIKTAITVTGDYPFSEEVRITLDPEEPVEFPLLLRIPGWCSDPEISVNSGKPEHPAPGEYYPIEKTWNRGDIVILKLPMKIEIHTRFNGSAAVRRGPLVYSLPVDGKWRKHENGTPYPDWEIRPVTPWNFGLSIDRNDPESSFTFSGEVPGTVPFSSKSPPSRIRCRGLRIPGWGISRNAAEAPPAPPFETEGGPRELMLVPYGCAKLRVTEMPVIPEE